MKRTVLFGWIVFLTIASCTMEKKSPIEGTWKMVYANWNLESGVFPDQIKGDQIKLYTKNYFSHTGEFRSDTTVYNSGCGTFTLDGNNCEETILIRKGETGLDKKYRLLINVSNDSLILRWPCDENWKLAEKFRIERYVRLN